MYMESLLCYSFLLVPRSVLSSYGSCENDVIENNVYVQQAKNQQRTESHKIFKSREE